VSKVFVLQKKIFFNENPQKLSDTERKKKAAARKTVEIYLS
jgi:hypothetical protein